MKEEKVQDEENERLEKEREEEEQKAKQKLEHERKENELVDKVIAALIEDTVENKLEEATSSLDLEWCATVQVRDKLVNDEISALQTTGELRRACAEVIDELRREVERKWKAEVRQRIEADTFEHLLNGCVDALIGECCERVVWEAQTQRAADIYEELLSDVVRNLIDHCILEIAFDDMTTQTMPFIGKIKPPPPKTLKRPHESIETPGGFSYKPIEKKPRTSQSIQPENWDLLQRDIEKCKYLYVSNIK